MDRNELTNGFLAVVSGTTKHPEYVMGPRVEDDKVFVSCYFPRALRVVLKIDRSKTEYEMEPFGINGFFTVSIPLDEKALGKFPAYTYEAKYEGGGSWIIKDHYAFDPSVDESALEAFSKGINYEIYKTMGAHVTEIDGVKGTRFAVWAPNAVNVNVVGDFNNWEGKRFQMIFNDAYGVWELFIPGVLEGQIYKYEIKSVGGLTVLKSDPYAFSAEKRPNNASVVYDIDKYKWNDATYLKKRDEVDYKERPISVYEVHLGSFMRPSDNDGDFYNYRELAEKLTEYVKKLGYTHVELLPIMEHPFDGSWGYQVTGYYAPTSRFGTPDDFMYFVDYLHKNGIGVILDWVPAHFPKDAFGLAKFDGTCLYEHKDPRQGEHPHWGTLIYNYHRPEVSNFLIGNAMYWVEKYHVDGIRIDAVASMLYLDYGKNDGEWIPNCYGGKENLDAIELLKHLNSMMQKRNPGTLMIAEESTAWPMVSGDVENGGLGFQLKWNMGFMNDFLGYMKQDPLFRKGNHNALTFSMMYAYSERFILVFSHDEVVHGKGSMIGKMPGSYENKFANLRAGYGYTYGHPGKKLLFMGQEFAQFAEWNENKALDWKLVEEYEMHQKMQTYVCELNKLYKSKKAMFEADYYNEGFKWINCNDWQKSYVTFTRQSKDGSNLLVFICNFTPVQYDEFTLGVPKKGTYTEILNSDDVKFGGKGIVNSKSVKSKEQEWDGYDDSITITLPGLSTVILEYKNPAKKAVKTEKVEKTAKTEKAEKVEKTAKAKKAVKNEKPEQAETEVKKTVRKTTKKKKTEE